MQPEARAGEGRRIDTLVRRGVVVPAPEQVFVGAEVLPERIAPGTVLFPGTRLHGARTWLGSGCEVGAEGPAVLRDAVLGERAAVASGYVEGAVLLREARLGANAHVRPGTLLEEEASTGHAVGLKQTILLSFVTLGSLVNFCDVLMAGGTSRSDHSEVGSGFVHFNFTPWGRGGDKATPSLVGDAVQGVFLQEKRIFLGGSGGMVGPRRIGYGSIAGAGQVLRRNVEAGRVVLEVPRGIDQEARAPLHQRIDSILALNAEFIGQLAALRAWYQQVRLARTPSGAAHEGERVVLSEAIATLAACSVERWKRLADFLGENGRAAREPRLEADLGCPLDLSGGPAEHVAWIRSRPEEFVRAGQAWLGEIARNVAGSVIEAAG